MAQCMQEIISKSQREMYGLPPAKMTVHCTDSGVKWISEEVAGNRHSRPTSKTFDWHCFMSHKDG